MAFATALGRAVLSSAALPPLPPHPPLPAEISDVTTLAGVSDQAALFYVVGRNLSPPR